MQQSPPSTHTAIDVCNGSKVVADFRRVVFELTASMAPAHYMSEIDLLCSRRLIVCTMYTTHHTTATQKQSFKITYT